MFTDQLTRAIAAARTPQLDHLSAELWKAYAAGALSDEDAQAAAEAIRERKLASAPKAPPPPKARRQRSPDRQASVARRRHLAASGPMPPALAARFTQAEMAALRIVSDEVRHHGVCGLHIDAIAARAGTCRTTVKNALREARRLNLVTVQERRRRGQRSLTNIIHIISREWRDWLAKGVGSENRLPRTSVQNRRQKTEALALAGNGITDTTTTKERDADAPKGATPFEGR
jgi:hypothetical protein